MSKTKKIIAFLLLLFAFLVVSGAVSFAQTNYIPLAPLPEAAPIEGTTGTQYILGMIRLLIGVAGVLAVIVIMIGGVKYLTAGDSASRTEDARDQITKALFGLILAIGSWLILTTIDPKILNIDLTRPTAPLPPAPAASNSSFPPENGQCFATNGDCLERYTLLQQFGGCSQLEECAPYSNAPEEEYPNGDAYCLICVPE